VSVSGESNRIAGYWEDWGSKPQASALQNYTHILLAFYESENKDCTLSTFDASLVASFHSAGVKVLGSVGGWSMNNWWKDCTVDSLVSQLSNAVTSVGLDGIDIDYEVDPPNASYVVNLTNSLRAKLGTGKLLTHVPENNQMVKNGTYWNIIAQVKNEIDFIMVQYYNDNPNPLTDPNGAISHYETIVTDLFGGDATKVVFGFCITECKGYNMDGQQAANITKSLLAKYPTTFGGIMDWAENSGDINGAWSAPSAALLNY